MKILFLQDCQPWAHGELTSILKKAGHKIISPPMADDFSLSFSSAQDSYDSHDVEVVIGLGRGGAVATCLQTKAIWLILLCPDWKDCLVAPMLKQNTMILHSRDDDVVPFVDSEELISKCGLRPESLIEVGRDHRMVDEQSVSVILWACKLLAAGEQVPWLEADEQPSSTALFSGGKSSSVAEASYICDACGEEIVIPLDLTEGSTQSYVEDCPVCCRANLIHVQIAEDGEAEVWAEPEQDYD